MRSVFTALQYYLLTKIAPTEPHMMNGSAGWGKYRLRISLRDELLDAIRGKTMIDFGCGEGDQCLERARHRASKVICIDIRNEPTGKGCAQSHRPLGGTIGVSFGTAPIPK